jgi:hypothetical protein
MRHARAPREGREIERVGERGAGLASARSGTVTPGPWVTAAHPGASLPLTRAHHVPRDPEVHGEAMLEPLAS